MFAIIKTGGKQYRVQEGEVLSVERLPAGPKKTVLFDQVLLIADDNETLIGTPFLEKAVVRAEVVEDFKDDKIIVFKKKRRKQYRRTRGHRQPLTRVKILNIAADAASLPPEQAAELEPAAEKTPVITVTEETAAAKMPDKKETKSRKKAGPAKPERARKPARAKKEIPAKKSSKKAKK
ncbi:MAG: 50S ribosomal protein L21 [Candidatus Aminicenantales bacterium]